MASCDAGSRLQHSDRNPTGDDLQWQGSREADGTVCLGAHCVPGPCTACVIAALFVLAAFRAAAPQETQVFINQGLVQAVGMVGRGHWPPKPVPVLSTLQLVAAAKQRVKNPQILTPLLHVKAP